MIRARMLLKKFIFQAKRDQGKRPVTISVLQLIRSVFCEMEGNACDSFLYPFVFEDNDGVIPGELVLNCIRIQQQTQNEQDQAG